MQPQYFSLSLPHNFGLSPPPPYDDISYDDGGGMSQLHFEKTEGEGVEESVSLAHMSAAAESGLKPISLSDKDVLETCELPDKLRGFFSKIGRTYCSECVSCLCYEIQGYSQQVDILTPPHISVVDGPIFKRFGVVIVITGWFGLVYNNT